MAPSFIDSTTFASDLATTWIQAAIDQADAAGGGRVVIPAGYHRTGALRLRSGIDLHLEAGAVLAFVADPALYPVVNARWEGALEEVYSPCLYAQNATDVSITGLGTIDGGGAAWWDVFRNRREELSHARPSLIGLHSCERVTIRDVKLRNSPSWTVHPALCADVTISGISILNPADSPNTDGINPESCRNVRISDCHIDVGDDCIAIKAGTEYAPNRVSCENIAITNCTMVHGHGGVVLGSEMSGGIRNVVISNCVFQGTDRGIRIKTRRGRGGFVEDVRVTNIVMDGVLCPFTVNPFYFCGPDGKDPQVSDRGVHDVTEATPSIRRIHISNVSARNVDACAGFLFGLPEQPLAELTIRDVSISFATDPKAGEPDMALGVEPMIQTGFLLGFLEDSEISGIRVHGVVGPLVTTESCTRLSVDVRGDHGDISHG